MTLTLKSRILRTLAQWPDRALQTQDIISALPGLKSPKSVQALLSVLYRDGLVERDNGEKGWFAITAKGLQKASQA